MGQHPCFVFPVMANPTLLKSKQGGIDGGVPSQRASGEVFRQYKFIMGEKSTEEAAARACAALCLPHWEIPTVAAQPESLLCGL